MKTESNEKLLRVSVSLNDLCFITQSLNEVCNGLFVDDFEGRIGENRDGVDAFLEKLSDLYDRSKNEKKEYIDIVLKKSEFVVIERSIKVVLIEMPEFEFKIRLGSSRDVAQKILNIIDNL